MRSLYALVGGKMVYKPFLSIDAQIELLRGRGVSTDSRTGWLLEREGYYSIVNGYKDLFLDSDTTAALHTETYRSGTSFNDLYELFVFDRKLRFQVFQIETIAEATLKTVCSYEFTKAYSNDKNPFLNLSSYGRDRKTSHNARKLIDNVFNKILELDGNPRNRGDFGGKAYIKHCMEDHAGEVPMWVLANDLTLGQIYWFYQVQNPEVRKNIAISFTKLYNDSHKHNLDVTSTMIDKIYRRIKDFRNICAHDERLYCAHPHDANITVLQLIKDLQYVTDKKRYLEFLQRVKMLTNTICNKIPSCSLGITTAMGLSDPLDLDQHMGRVRAS
jgi:abortive infection bacteriophage resistance protein